MSTLSGSKLVLPLVPMHLKKKTKLTNMVTSPSQNALDQAVENGDVPRIREILLFSANSYSISDEEYRREVRRAVDSESSDVLRALLVPKVIAILHQSSLGEDKFLLHKACENGHTAISRILLDAGFKVDEHDSDGYMPLHKAALQGHCSTLEVLIQAHAIVNVRNHEDQAPLYIATFRGHAECVKALLKAGADINALNGKFGRTALHVAANQGYIEIVTALIEWKADIMMKSSSVKWTPLHYAHNYKDISQILLEVDRRLISTRSKQGSTPLNLAAMKGSTDVVEFLINRGSEIDTADSDGLTPLHNALLARCTGIAKLLIENGATPNICDKNGNTPLHLAGGELYIKAVNFIAVDDCVEISHLLLRRGASLERARLQLNTLLGAALYTKSFKKLESVLDLKEVNAN